MENNLFPIFLKTEQLRFLIVGGGKAALEKLSVLIKQNPSVNVKVIAKEFKQELNDIFVDYPTIKQENRAFTIHDLEHVDVVIVAIKDKEIIQKIKENANEKGILVHVVHQPDLSDFYFGTIVKKDHLNIAIHANKKYHKTEKYLSNYLSDIIPDSIDEKTENFNQLTSSVEGKKISKKYKRLVTEITLVFFALFIGYALSSIVSFSEAKDFVLHIPNVFYVMLAIGFFAQMVDGAVGLGYGVTCSTSMMLFGVNLPSISGSIHTAEMFSSGISGFSHYKFGNVNKKLLVALAIPGIIGAISGSLLLVYLGNKYETITYGILASYTLIIGIRLIILAFRKKIERKKVKRVGLLGFSGGFLDAFGGGGWGPVVTSTLLAKGKKSNLVVGTVSLAEFFVTLSASLTFFVALGVSHGFIIAGLIIGGALAAPIAAKLAGKIPQKIAVLAVAFLVIIFSIRILFKML
ncbi:TSUP family transporter [Empedobacter brevis]|uniref:TSUP family transporter n=1 Tax=Empedobacter brevis TaxID=247 RepID=UPI0039AF473A